MYNQEILNRIVDSGIVAVIRAKNNQQANEIVEAVIKGGITAIELTFTVPHVAELIQELNTKYNNTNIIIGAGTVTSSAQCLEAIEAGAKFVVGPGFDEDVLSVCDEYKIPYIPGCMTISEMMKVTKLGCEIVKLFPGDMFGPAFIKSVKGPLPGISIMPTGGVDLDNIDKWMEAGAAAVGIGSKLTYPAKTNDMEKITELAKEFIQKIKQIKQV